MQLQAAAAPNEPPRPAGQGVNMARLVLQGKALH